MGTRRRRAEPAAALPVVTAEQVAADRAAGYLARAWTLPSPPVGALAPSFRAVVDPVTDPPLPSVPPVSTALVLEIAPGRTVPLRSPAVLGRRVAEAPNRVAVLLDDPNKSVSREHAAIRPTADGTVIVEDLRSANGTTVVHASGAQEDSVAGRQVVALPGDTIMLGDYSVRVLPA
jgi:hypothetical protein